MGTLNSHSSLPQTALDGQFPFHTQTFNTIHVSTSLSQSDKTTGIKFSSILTPTGLIVHQVRDAFKSVQSPSSHLLKLSCLHLRFVPFLKLNGLFTSLFTLSYTFFLSSFQFRPFNSSLFFHFNPPTTTTRSNEYSIIGGTLGGLITTTIYYKMNLFNLIQILPGGISLGVAFGLSTCFFSKNSKLFSSSSIIN